MKSPKSSHYSNKSLNVPTTLLMNWNKMMNKNTKRKSKKKNKGGNKSFSKDKGFKG